jgi:Pectate lyase superfamily protein
MRLSRLLVGVAALTTVVSMSWTGPAVAQPGAAAVAAPDLGPNVKIFDPSMPTSQIQATVDAIAHQQVGNQFGPQRYALLFKPGTYGTAAAPLNFQVGYYTTVAGLGLSPNDVVINGSVYVHNQCDANNSCTALNNFWRSLENLTINVTTPDFGCYTGEFWAVSQAAPMRRVHVNGPTTLMDYCTGPSFASGGFIADSQFDGNLVNGSQQQWMTRNSALTGWSNGVWNQVFAGVAGAPAQCFPAVVSGCGPYTTIAASPVTREAPFLYVDSRGSYNVFVPAPRHGSSGTSWGSGPAAGVSIPLNKFMVASPADSVAKINQALASGQNLLLTPGTYAVDKTIQVKRKDAVVLGIGFPTLTPTKGNVTMSVADVAGVDITGAIFDAGPVRSPVLLKVGRPGAHNGSDADPTALQDVFFRIGGAAAGKAVVSLEVDSSNTILDNTWAWRADHGNGVGWTVNTADTGVVVNGDDVTAYGLFVEHYQKLEVRWNGNGGKVFFFQNEMPYDVPSQAAWSEAPGVNGYAAFKVADSVTSFNGYGMGSYSFFNQGVDIFADNAFEVPATLPAGSLQDLLTVFLDASNGKGGITNVINGVGGSSTSANPDVPVTVVSYP